MIVSSNSERKHLHTSDRCTNTFDHITEAKMSAADSKGSKSPRESKDGFSHEATICLQCGDEGATNAFVYCVNCLEYAVHRYCLDTLPKTLDEFVNWVCDDCAEVPREETSSKDVETGRKDCHINPKHVKNNPKKKHVEGKTGNKLFKSNENAEKGTREDKHKENDQQPHSSPLSTPSLDCRLESCKFAQPVIDPIWNGSFNIVNNKESDEEGVDRLIVAHLSTKVGKLVFDEVNSFPSMLELELHPKAHVWPKRFHKLKPSDGDIAIYFFPISSRYEGVFDELVEEMMDRELALKAITKNAELLVFPSNELPLSFWRFQEKYFLWGVFRGKQSSSSQVGSTSEERVHIKRAKY